MDAANKATSLLPAPSAVGKVIGDLLGGAIGIIRRPPATSGRLRTLSTYLRLHGMHVLSRRVDLRPPYVQRIQNAEVEVLGYAAAARMFEEIFILQDYQFEAGVDSPRIIDCGSNVGMAILFFKTLYPTAQILGVEADRATFDVLTRNVARNHWTGVEVLYGAVGVGEGTVNFYSDPEVPGSLRNSTLSGRMLSKGQQVPIVSLADLIVDEVDCLKMDIEGAEREVIPDLAARGKLALVRQMLIEYHHHIEPDDDGLSEVLRVLEANGFRYQLHSAVQRPFRRGMFQDILLYAYRA